MSVYNLGSFTGQETRKERKGNLTGRREETEPLQTTLEPSLSRRERRESSHLPVRRSVRRQRPLGRRVAE